MSRPVMAHPGEEDLLRYTDGELPARDAQQVREHLAACWQCRSELEDIERTIAECVRYRKTLSECSLPSPPAPWCDIYLRFAEMESAPGSFSFAGRLRRILRPANVLRWAAVAAAVILAILVAGRFRNTPTVSAAELLRKAAVQSAKAPRQPRRLHIRTRTREFTRLTGVAAVSAGVSQDQVALAALFANARFDWNDPLDPRAFAAWREQLPDKTDEVAMVRDVYRVSTTPAAGFIERATIDLRVADLGAVQEILEFRNSERVEITELPAGTAPAGVPTVENPPTFPRPATPVPEPAAQAAPVTASDELRVFAALHRLGADLGEPVDVARTGSGILVSGVGVDPPLRRRIEEELSGMPRVQVRLSEDRTPDGGADAAPAGTLTNTPGGAALQELLEKSLGGKVAAERFALEVLDESEMLMARAHALRRLAERFPALAETQMSPQDRVVLRRLCREHAGALLERTEELGRRMAPLGAPRYESRVAASGSWQTSAQALFHTARRVEVLVAALAGGTPVPGSPLEVPDELIAVLSSLRAQTAECLTHTAQ